MQPVQPVRPSETTTFIRCPRLWWYREVGKWEPPASAWSPERLVGTAIHAGVASYWAYKKVTHTILMAIDDCKWAFSKGWPPNAPLGFSRDALESHALKVLDKVLAWIIE